MKVLHVINGELYAGAERVQDLLALALPSHGFEVGFACIKPDQFPLKRRSTNVPLHLTPMRWKAAISCALTVARIIRNEDYRLVHTHTPRSALVGRIAASIASVPMVHHVHSPTQSDTESQRRNRINAAAERVALLGVSRLIAVSTSLARYLTTLGHPPARIRMVPNGVPSQPSLWDRPAPVTPWVLGCVALFRPRKGLEVLIDALAMLNANGHACRLRAVGAFETENYRQSMLQLAQDRGVHELIDWVGFSNKVDAELLKMDTLVLPSLFGEGMPMVILEAMAAGVPVVASNVEGTPEVIEHGRSGLIVNPGDASALSTTIGQLLDGGHDWQALRQHGYQRQKAHFSDTAMAAGVAGVYRELLPADDKR